MNKIVILVIFLFLFSCADDEGAGDPAPTGAAAPMYDSTTKLGFKIQSNGYDFDSNFIDNAFLETESCLGYKDTPTDLYIVLKEPYSAFPCTPLPKTGCGGLYQSQTITITADFVRLKHEYIHYLLDYHANNQDSSHESPLFAKCS